MYPVQITLNVLLGNPHSSGKVDPFSGYSSHFLHMQVACRILLIWFGIKETDGEEF